MPTPYSGLPAEVANALPAALSISSTTNATPIVVTTSTAHGLRPGDYLYITGATDPAANGVFLAGLTASTTQVQLLTAPGGANVAGTLAGGAVGTLQALGFGETLPLVNDATDKRTAASVNVPFEALADRTAFLMYMMQFSVRRKVWRRKRVDVSDASQTLSVLLGDRFELAATPAAPRIITLKSTSPAVPAEGECIELLVAALNASTTVYTVKREDGTVIATFTGSATRTVQPMFAEFEFTSGVWRLGANSGAAYDGAGDYGIIPGAGA